MPTYEYKCKSCGKMSEFFQSMTAKPMKQCPHCAKNALERQIGIGAAVMFKGSGFYQTDYRSESYKKAAEAESKSATSSSSGESQSTGDASGASAAETKPKDNAPKQDGSPSAPTGESARPAKTSSSSAKVRTKTTAAKPAGASTTRRGKR